MARKSESRTIGGVLYEVTQLPGMQSLKLFSKLAGILAPAMARAAGVAKGGLDLTSIDMGVIGDAVELLAEKLTPDQLEAVTKELLSQCSADGKPMNLEHPVGRANFDEHFAGRVEVIFLLLKFAFEVNYGNFSSAAAGLISKAAAMAKKGAASKSEESTT